jgi:hypothetical protein
MYPLKKILFSLFILFLLSVTTAFSQTLRKPVSAIYLGLSAYSTDHTDVFSFVHNQASLAGAKMTSAGAYGERRFLLAATSVYTMAIAIPTTKGNFGIDLDYAGFTNYNESQVGLAYARNLGKKIDVGIQFNYYGFNIPYYGGAATIYAEIGAIVHLTDKLNLGMHIYNPTGGNFARTSEKLTSIFTSGIGYDASDNFFVGAEVVKEESLPVTVNAGVQYRFEKQFFARMGISSATSSTYMGFGVAWDIFRIDVSVSNHPQLGISPGLLFIMNFGKKKNV